MLSKVIGIYRIASDIEMKFLPSGSAVAKVNLVNSSKYKTQSGEQKEDTCFIYGSVFGKQAEILNTYCQKGSKIYIVGELKQDTWKDNQGQKRSVHSIKIDSFEFLDSKPQTSSKPHQNAPSCYTQQNGQGNQELPEIDIDEDSIPF